MPDDLDQKQEKLFNILKELDRDTTTPGEVAEALHVVLQILANVRQELLDNSTSDRGVASRALNALFDKVRGLINGEAATRKKEQDRLGRLITDILNWKKERDESTEAADIAEALEGVDENTESIRKIRASLKELQRTPGPRGPRGRAPAHEWDDTRLRFANPDGTWGEWVDLRGPEGFGQMFGGGPAGDSIFAITTNGTTGPATFRNGVLNIPQYSGGSGSTQTLADPTSGAVNDSNLAFDFAVKPFLIVVNNRTYREGHGWSWAGSTATLAADPGPVGTGGEIYGIIQS